MKTATLVLLVVVALSSATGCISSSRHNEKVEEKNDGSVQNSAGYQDISSSPAAIPVATREIADQLDKLQGEMI